MRASPSLVSFVVACALGLTVAWSPLPASAADQQEAAAAPAPQFSKGFQKAAGKVQKLVQEQKWSEVLEGVKTLEALEGLTPDDRNVIFSWKLQAYRGTGDEAALNAYLEQHLENGYAQPSQVGPIHQQLAAWYNKQKNPEKTRYHYRKFIDATPDASPQEFETLGRLYFQADENEEAVTWLGKAIDGSASKGEKPKELWYQLRDQAFVELNDGTRRLANLESLVKQYPKPEYYTRVIALYQQGSGDDKVLMLHAYRLAMTDTGLETVGQYLSYADLAIAVGSPGEGERALQKGLDSGVVPNAGSNQQLLAEAKAAAGRDRRDLPKDAAAAAKGTNGEVDAKIGLGFYSIGQPQQAVETIERGLQKGGVKRLDDANLTLAAALADLGRYDEARAAIAKAAEVAGAGSWMARMAGLWDAYVQRKAGTAPAG
jgi:hypothetical protein